MADPTLLTYYGGLILGCLIILAVLVVYLFNRKLDIGGIMFTLVGFLLVGLSIWKTLDLDLKQGQLHVELRVLEQRNSSSAGAPANLSPSVVSSVRYKVAVVNSSITISDGDIESAVAALQKQVSEHLSPVWGVSADLSFIPRGAKVPPDTWRLEILDKSDAPGALGYHDVSANGLPVGKVFAADNKASGTLWTVTASHELITMLVNPRINLTVFISSNSSSGSEGRLYAHEIASPCAGDEDGYTIDEIRVSDFVYPSWFEPSAKSRSTQFDYRNHIKKPLEVRPGGYISVYDIKGGSWRPIFRGD